MISFLFSEASMEQIEVMEDYLAAVCDMSGERVSLENLAFVYPRTSAQR